MLQNGSSPLLTLSAYWCYAVRYGKTITDRVPGCMDQFQMNKYSSVSSVIERVKALLVKDRRLKDTVETLVLRLNKSQEQIYPGEFEDYSTGT